MIKSEWKSLFKNKFMMVVVIAIMIIPTIYTTIFLGSMWDPYGEIDKLPVAIVNNDKSVVYEDKTMDVGKELVDNLKENNSLDFNFVDNDVAKSGLENGTYYMVVTIPEDFSENATTLMDETPKQMTLEYEINPGTNYIASKMSETAVTKIRNSIQEKITKEYAETIFAKVNELGEGLTEAADGTNDALDGVNKLKDGNGEITSGAKELASKSLVFKDGADELKVGLDQYTDGVKKAKDGSAELEPGIKQYTDGVQRAKEGSVQIASGLGSLNGAVPKISSGINQISSNSNLLNEGVYKLSESNNKIVNALGMMSDTIGEVVNADSESQKKINELKDANSALNDGIQDFNNKIQNADSSNIASSLQAIGSNAEAAGNVYKNTTSQIVASSAFNSLSDTQKAEILNILQNNGTDLNNNLTSIGNDTKKVANDFSSSMNNIKTGVKTVADQSKLVLPANTSTINQLTGGLSTIKYSLDKQGKNPEDMGLIQAAKAIGNGTSDLATGVNNYTSAVDKLNESTIYMPLGINKLFLGASELHSGLNELTSNNGRINGGISELHNGLNKLTSKNGEILSGTSELSDGAQKISDGSGKLADGSETLGNGLNDLYDGTVKLNDGLTSGADEVNGMNTSDDTYEMIANPVEADESLMTNVDNNGNAMAPYMMCVGLWVACIAFCIMYPLTSYTGKMESGFKWWLSKASILGVVTVLQAIIMVLMLKGINGLNPARLPQTILIACVASLTFMAIMYFFNILLGKVGSFLMLVFMVLQLGGCAGTYPVELAAPIYSIIKPFMPFTYCVHAFRASICDGVSITKDILVLLSILVVFVLMTIGVFHFKAGKVMNEKKESQDSLVNA